MKRMWFALLAGGLTLFSVPIQGQVCPTCPSFEKSSSAAVHRLAGLVGCWKGRGPNDLAAKVAYELGSDKTALLETLYVEKNPAMYTVYYLDGDAPRAHHFCSYGNQLRMQAEPSSDPNVISFKFADATNLRTSDDNHMTYVKFFFKNPDRLDVEWGLYHARRHMPQPFTFRRVTEGCTARADW